MGDKPVRLKLFLGKFPVVGVRDVPTGFEFGIRLDVDILAVTCPKWADIQVGDFLPLYTEIYTNDPAISTSLQ